MREFFFKYSLELNRSEDVKMERNEESTEEPKRTKIKTSTKTNRKANEMNGGEGKNEENTTMKNNKTSLR